MHCLGSLRPRLSKEDCCQPHFRSNLVCLKVTFKVPCLGMACPHPALWQGGKRSETAQELSGSALENSWGMNPFQQMLLFLSLVEKRPK